MTNKSTIDRSLAIARWLGRAAPWLMAELALRRFATPPKPAPASAAVSAGAERVRFLVDGREISALARGEGKVVALLHGWGGASGQFGGFLEPLARAGFRAVAIDAPAHGASGGKRATLPSFARALQAVARVEGPLAAVVAHSLGAAGATLAMADGLDVERAVFLAPASDVRRHFEAYSAALGLDRDLMLRRAERRYGIRWRDVAAVERARGLTQPLLVFHDAGDRAVANDEVEALVRSWNGAELRVTRGLGHRRLLDDARVIAETVAFIALARGAARS